MAITIDAFTFTEAVSTTEWSVTNDSSTIAAQTDDGVYQLWLDLSDMVSGDVLEIRGYEKVRTGDTQKQFLPGPPTLIGPQSPALMVFPTVILGNGWDFTVKATTGTITVIGGIRKVA